MVQMFCSVEYVSSTPEELQHVVVPEPFDILKPHPGLLNTAPSVLTAGIGTTFSNITLAVGRFNGYGHFVSEHMTTACFPLRKY